jgi:hypothetical protein
MKTLFALGALCASALAWGQQTPACDPALCGASGLSAKALTSAAQEEKPKASSGMLAAIRDNQRRTEQSSDAWNRHMPVRPDLESYDCILSFGVGGELSKKGFVGSRVGGQTQTWR